MIKIFDFKKNRIVLEYFLLSILLLGAFFVRLYKITNPIADWHSWRQADTASVTRIYVQNGIDPLFPKYHDISSIQTGFFNPEGLRLVEFPIYNIIHATVVKAFPGLTLEIWGRLLSVIFSLSSTVLIYLIGKSLLNAKLGILSAFFFAFLPFNIYFSRTILPEPLCVFFILASIYSLFLYIDRDKSSLLYISAVFFAISMLIKPYIGFYIIPMFYLLFKKYGLRGILDKKIMIKLSIFLDIALIPFFLWRIWINNYPQGIPVFDWAFNGDKIRFRPSFWRWIFGERIGHLILGSWGVVLLAMGWLSTVKKNYFIQFCLLGMVMYVTVVATASVRHDYYQILVIPALSFALGYGFYYLWEAKEFNKYLRQFLAIFSVFIMLITSFSQVKEFYKINHPEIIEAGSAVDKIAPKNSLVIAPYNGDTAFLYQTGHSGWPVVDTSIEDLITKGAKYYVSVNFADPDNTYIEKNFKVIEKTSKYLIADLTKRTPTK